MGTKSIREVISDLQQFAERLPSGLDAPVVLYDTNTQDANADDFDFEILRGNDEVVIEFKG